MHSYIKQDWFIVNIFIKNIHHSAVLTTLWATRQTNALSPIVMYLLTENCKIDILEVGF